MVLYLLESQVQKRVDGIPRIRRGACRYKEQPDGMTFAVWNWFEMFDSSRFADRRYDELKNMFGDAWSGTILDITAAGSALRDQIRVKDLIEQVMYGADVCAPPELNSEIVNRHWESDQLMQTALSEGQDLKGEG